MGDSAARAKLLIIDDDAMVVQALRRLLRDDGYTIDSANDAPAALATIQYRIPDLILLDSSLPSVGGIALCRELRSMAATADTPIIMLTGMNTEERRAQAMAAGADDFIGKPYDPTDLRARIRAWIERHHLSSDARVAEP